MNVFEERSITCGIKLEKNSRDLKIDQFATKIELKQCA